MPQKNEFFSSETQNSFRNLAEVLVIIICNQPWQPLEVQFDWI